MILSLNKKHLIFVLGFFLLNTVLLAQEPVKVDRSNNKVILEGTVYYIHVVKPGQTLYSIAKAYNISQKEIAIENPGVISGLQLGQAIKIPVEPAMEEEIDTSDIEQFEETGRTHIVRPGETLYRIARDYKVNEVALKEANEGLDESDLQPGQKLVIPERGESEPESAFNEEGFAYHNVKRRETVYSIAKYYGVTVQEIRTANPELGWGGPETGQTIRIPLPQVIDRPDITHEATLIDSTMYLESDLELENYNYEELSFEHENPYRTYRIAFFIPFDFQEPEPLDSLIKNANSETRRNRIIERYRMEQKIPQGINFLEFFLGSLLAIDSLQQTGIKMDLRFYDTKKSMDQTLSHLINEELEEFDLFIGPFYPFNLEIVSAFAKKHRIPVVTPFYNEPDLVRRNPYLFQLSPSIEREYEEAAKIIASKHMYNIVYVREADSLNIEEHNHFKELIFDGFDDYRPSEPVVFKEIIQSLEHTDEIIHSLSNDKKNLVVVPTRNEALASRVVSSLYFKLKDYDIEVIGAPFWTEFSSIDYRYYHGLNLIFFSSFWVDYLDPGIDHFMTNYRNHFKNEPLSTTRRGINYGIIGYDMTYYFINALRLNGPRFILSLDEYEPRLIQNTFRFHRVTNAGGYENEQITFYKFSPDMSIKKIEVPELPVRNFFFRPIEDNRRRRNLYRERNRE
jgi:LysM repeat protein